MAGLRRGKNQSAKELADRARRLASRAYHSNDYASQEKAALHAFPNSSWRASAVEVRRAKLSDLGDGGGNHRAPGTVYTKSNPGSQAGGVRTGSVLEGHGEEALIGEIKDNREQRKQWAARRETGRRRKANMECHSCHQKGHFARECPTNATETDSHRCHNRPRAPGGCGGGGDGHGGEQTISPGTDRGEQDQLPGRHGIRGVYSVCPDLEEVGSCRR